MPPDPQTSPTAARRPGRPRQSQADVGEVRGRLLDAATELAVEQGFDACGLREIASRAEVSPGMIAYYFGDRQGLYEAMFQRAFDRIASKVRALLSDPGRAEGDRIGELVRIQVEAIAADPWLPRLVIREVLVRGESPMADSLGEIIAKGPMQMMIGWLEEEQAKHVIREDLDPRMLAMTIASLTGFPFLMLPVVGDQIGIQLDDDFPEKLIEHNRRILDCALRARTEDER